MEYTRSMTVLLRLPTGDQVVDQRRRCNPCDRRETLHSEVAAEVFVRRIALDALSGQQPKQIAPLCLGHEAHGTGRGRLGTRRNRLGRRRPVAGLTWSACGVVSTRSG